MEQLKLLKNQHKIYQCLGRFQGDYPIYTPRNSKLAEKIVHNFYKKTLHGRVILKMTTVKDQYWIPKLKQMTKRIIRNCYGCKRYHIKPYDTPTPGQLKKARTTVTREFQ